MNADEIRAAADKVRLAVASAHEITLWEKDASLLVADLLDHFAGSFDQMQAQNDREGITTRVLPNIGEMTALKLARSINGGGSDAA